MLAGIKAGVIAGIAYIGTLAAANLVLLYVSRQDILNYITSNFSLVCSPVNSVNATSIQDCFNSLAPVYLPFIAFFGFFVTLVYSAVFGRLYDRLPGRSPVLKGMTVAPLAAITLVYFQLLGFTFELSATEALVVVLLVSTIAYGILLGRFYKRYTRLIQFVSEDESGLRIVVGRSDLTGKTCTLAANSSHNIEAKVSDDSSFKGWSVSGGVAVEDAKSFETTMEVNGDGLLKGLVAKKY
jgi:uncharacterized protein DUF6789